MADMTSALQLALWVDGHPFHMGDRDDPRSQCCPDFSCCRKGLLQPREVRETFKAAIEAGDEVQKLRMLGQFLGCMVAGPENTLPAVHIGGMSGPVRELIECAGCPGCYSGDCAEGYYPKGGQPNEAP